MSSFGFMRPYLFLNKFREHKINTYHRDGGLLIRVNIFINIYKKKKKKMF